MTNTIPEPKFLVAAAVPLSELADQHCSEELPTLKHLRALIHMANYNVPSDLPWRLVVGWRTHDPITLTPEVRRTVSPITAGTSEVLPGDFALFVQLVESERYVDANSGALLTDFDSLLNSLAGYVLARVQMPATV